MKRTIPLESMLDGLASGWRSAGMKVPHPLCVPMEGLCHCRVCQCVPNWLHAFSGSKGRNSINLRCCACISSIVHFRLGSLGLLAFGRLLVGTSYGCAIRKGVPYGDVSCSSRDAAPLRCPKRICSTRQMAHVVCMYP